MYQRLNEEGRAGLSAAKVAHLPDRLVLSTPVFAFDHYLNPLKADAHAAAFLINQRPSQQVPFVFIRAGRSNPQLKI